MERIYFFIFYTLLLFWEKISAPKIFSKFKAELSLIIIKILIYYCIIFSYSIINKTKPTLSLTEPIVFIPCGVIILLNIIIFDFSEKWKIYLIEFEALPKKKASLFIMISWIIIILIIVIFFILGDHFRKIS
ncbi:hypothetical protein [Empedobacter brevis]|uniref:hypothetical protein n=1 Tax=Empedobacter brevis TaxID=247 RepID=UPI0028A617C3|nr:hypothetical protein [Empedobacter brevis]